MKVRKFVNIFSHFSSIRWLIWKNFSHFFCAKKFLTSRQNRNLNRNKTVMNYWYEENHCSFGWKISREKLSDMRKGFHFTSITERGQALPYRPTTSRRVSDVCLKILKSSCFFDHQRGRGINWTGNVTIVIVEFPFTSISHIHFCLRNVNYKKQNQQNNCYKNWLDFWCVRKIAQRDAIYSL